jgi:prepilin-type N-terminal cleavage/methylation domain-containing protein
VKDKKSARQDSRSPLRGRPCRRACRSTAFTLVELLVVLGIIAILVALLVPALTAVKNMAKETQQKAQLTTIEMGLTAFKNDYGDYPPSHGYDSSGNDYDYCGAQTLAEALVGWDLLGFHPRSEFTHDGKTKDGSKEIYPYPLDPSDPDDEKNLKERRGPYLELATANVFRLGNSSGSAEDGLFDSITPVENTYVICDVFTVRIITIGSGRAVKTVKAGTPILYYKANTSSKIFDPNSTSEDQIYNLYDNFSFIRLGSVTADGSAGKDHPLGGDSGRNLYNFDYGESNVYGIRDSRITTTAWPHRPDSYILISAGADGLYGTSDDIRNF